MKGYYTQCTVFDRESDTVYPVRVKREWQDNGNAQTTYQITECETVPWRNLACKARDLPDWDSNRMKPVRREDLKALGLLWEPGDRWPNGCFTINP